MIAIGIVMGALGGALQLFLIHKSLAKPWSLPQRIAFFAVRFLLWAALFIAGALIAPSALVALIATATLLLVGYQVAVYRRIRKEENP